MDKQPSTRSLIILSSFVFFLIALILLYFWKKESMFSYVSGQFSTRNIVNDILIGLFFVAIAYILIYIIMQFGKLYYPNTSGVRDLVQLLQNSRSDVVIVSILPALSEEIFFRGVLLGLLLSFTNEVVAILVTSILFVLAHLGDQYNGQYYLLAYIFIIGIMTSLSYVLQGTLWPAVIIHSLSNFLSAILTRYKRIPIREVKIK